MVSLQKARKSDLGPLLRLIRISNVFNKDEKAVARELAVAALKKRGEDKDYKLLVASHSRGGLVGYACYGPSPMTTCTWDVYWIIVSPRFQRSGIGKSILLAAQKDIRSRKGRRIVVDTSSQASYRPARALYESAGFKPICVVPNYYRRGWHRITYYKEL